MNYDYRLKEWLARFFGQQTASRLWREVEEILEIAALKRGSRRG